MIKRFSVAALALMLLCAAPVFAQVKFGVQAGVNLSAVKFSGELLDKSNRLGFHVGPTLLVMIPATGFGVDLSALYSQQNAAITVSEGSEQIVEQTENMRQSTIDIPLNVRYGVGLGSAASVYLYAGPQLSFNLSNGIDRINWSWKKSYASLNAGIGAMLLGSLQVSLGYNIGLGDAGESLPFNANKSTLKGRNNAFKLSAAYYF